MTKRRKLSPARPVQLPLFVEAASLVRVRSETNEWRYYRLDAHSDDCSHRFRLKPATCSDRSQPGIPMIPAG